jgi:hypothetical protein
MIGSPLTEFDEREAKKQEEAHTHRLHAGQQ